MHPIEPPDLMLQKSSAKIFELFEVPDIGTEILVKREGGHIFSVIDGNPCDQERVGAGHQAELRASLGPQVPDLFLDAVFDLGDNFFIYILLKTLSFQYIISAVSIMLTLPLIESIW